MPKKLQSEDLPLLKAVGYSQDKFICLSQIGREIGVNATVVGRWLRGKRVPSANYLKKLAIVLECDELFLEEEIKKLKTTTKVSNSKENSQSCMAKRLGVTFATVNRWLNGVHRISFPDLERLAVEMGTTPLELQTEIYQRRQERLRRPSDSLCVPSEKSF